MLLSKKLGAMKSMASMVNQVWVNGIDESANDAIALTHSYIEMLTVEDFDQLIEIMKLDEQEQAK